MATVTKSVEVNVPVRIAHNQWTQMESFPQFMEGVQEVHLLDDKHMHWVAEVGGKRQVLPALEANSGSARRWKPPYHLARCAVEDICRTLKISQTTLWRYLKRASGDDEPGHTRPPSSR